MHVIVTAAAEVPLAMIDCPNEQGAVTRVLIVKEGAVSPDIAALLSQVLREV